MYTQATLTPKPQTKIREKHQKVKSHLLFIRRNTKSDVSPLFLVFQSGTSWQS